MKIEVGKWYKTEEGPKAYVAVEVPNSSPEYACFMGWVETASGNEWCVWRDDGLNKFGYSLVSEWVEKPEWCRGNPAWARWQAHDEDGECWWFSEKPSFDNHAWGYSGDYACSYGLIPDDNAPNLPPGCRWQDSLVEAPEGWGK